MPTFGPARLSRQLELTTPIVRIKTSYNKHVVQYTESLETSFLSFRESRVIPITNQCGIGTRSSVQCVLPIQDSTQAR